MKRSFFILCISIFLGGVNSSILLAKTNSLRKSLMPNPQILQNIHQEGLQQLQDVHGAPQAALPAQPTRCRCSLNPLKAFRYLARGFARIVEYHEPLFEAIGAGAR